MTPAAALLRLREIVDERARLDAEERALIDQLANGGEAQADYFVETGVAMKITKMTSSSLYRAAKRHGLGHQIGSGSWRFSARKLREFVSPNSARGEFDYGTGEFGEARGLPCSARCPHNLETTEDISE